MRRSIECGCVVSMRNFAGKRAAQAHQVELKGCHKRRWRLRSAAGIFGDQSAKIGRRAHAVAGKSYEHARQRVHEF